MPRGLVVVTPPAGEPVSLAEAKAHCRQDQSNDDALIAGLIVAARKYVENAVGRALVSQTYKLTLDRFPRYSSSAVWQYNSDAIWQQRLPVTQLSGQWYPDRASIRVPRPPMQQMFAITYVDGMGINQTLVSTVAAGISSGTQTVTPATMIGIVPGLQVIVDVGTAQETVTVASVTGTTFTATFAQSHPVYVPLWVIPTASNPLAGGPLVNVDLTTEPARIAPAYGQIWPIVRQQLASVQVLYQAGYGPVTTIPAGVPAPGAQTLTPASMSGIYPGVVLTVDTGTTTQEDVGVTATTATTFTATFAQSHTAGCGINSVPDPLRLAMKLLIGHWYENREAAAPQPPQAMALAVDALISDFWHGEYE